MMLGIKEIEVKRRWALNCMFQCSATLVAYEVVNPLELEGDFLENHMVWFPALSSLQLSQFRLTRMLLLANSADTKSCRKPRK